MLNRNNTVDQITVADILKDENQGQIIDVREVDEYQETHVPGAINVPMFGLMMNPDQFLNKDETYYIICQTGNRSHQVCSLLGAQGYHVMNVLGGTSEYVEKFKKK